MRLALPLVLMSFLGVSVAAPMAKPEANPLSVKADINVNLNSASRLVSNDTLHLFF